jgi:hypothetical protein
MLKSERARREESRSESPVVLKWRARAPPAQTEDVRANKNPELTRAQPDAVWLRLDGGGSSAVEECTLLEYI